jgi:hypothetical protein
MSCPVGILATRSMPSSASSDSIRYYSAHRGPVFSADGKFHHFARQCDPVHLKNGYWKFKNYEDDRRAFALGFNNPEEALKAQDAGDGDYDDIMLLWVPGELDKSNKTSVGTAAVHLQTIYNERKLLGKTLSFRGAVPLYPVSNDSRLLQYRLTRYGIQKGALAHDLLAPRSPSLGMSPPQTRPTTGKLSATCMPISSPSASPAVSSPTPTPALRSPQPQSRAAQSSPSLPAPTTSALDHVPVRSGPLITASEPAQSKAHLDSVEDLQTLLSIGEQYHNDTPLESPAINADNLSITSAVDLPNNIERPGPEERFLNENMGYANDKACYMHDSGDDATDSVATLSLTASQPADLFHAHAASLPCMDCGSIGSHTSECWINEATLSLRPIGDLTSFELDCLASQVKDFDPAPWTTHFGPPQQVVEDASTQLRGMAEVIRSLDASVGDPDLQGLDDQSTILLWALKSIGEVQILETHREQTDVEMLDM